MKRPRLEDLALLKPASHRGRASQRSWLTSSVYQYCAYQNFANTTPPTCTTKRAAPTALRSPTFPAADEIQDLTKAGQEAAEARFGADNDPIPTPTAPDAWASDDDYQGGFWMMVDIDLSKVRSKLGQD